jgi:hypothetical protein
MTAARTAMSCTRYALLLFLATAGARGLAADPVDDMRKDSGELIRKLGAALKEQMAAKGPEAAISVCRDLAPSLAGEISRRTGTHVARVSLKTRNPLLGQPDAWEQAVLMEFDRKVAAGEKPETLEYSEVVTEPQGRFQRYMKALPTQPLCLACHGDPAAMADGVRAALAAEYPHDRATGYAAGQVRGAVTVKRLLAD